MRFNPHIILPKLHVSLQAISIASYPGSPAL